MREFGIYVLARYTENRWAGWLFRNVGKERSYVRSALGYQERWCKKYRFRAVQQSHLIDISMWVSLD